MITEKTSFIGKFEGTADDLINQFTRNNSSKADRAKRLAPLYIKYGGLFNLRADLAWAQMEHETGYLEFKGIAKPEWNNFAGIGITGAGAKQTFNTEELGIIAHFAHLAWYFFPDHVNKYCSSIYDPRHFGKSHYLYSGDSSIGFLGGRWAYPGKTYAQRIADIANQIFISEKMVTTPEIISQKVKDALGIRSKYNWQYIAVHHSVSDQFKTSMEQIKRWHLARGFLREGYNFGINGNGDIEVGRPLTMSGAHVGPKYNSKAIGICLYGDFRKDKLTDKQKESAFNLIKQLMKTHNISIENVLGHKEFPGLATACPVFDMNNFRKELQEFLN